MNILPFRHPHHERAIAVLWIVLSAAFIFLPIICLAAVLGGVAYPR
jgi:hypothetical protein